MDAIYLFIYSFWSQVISLGLPLQRIRDVIDNKDVYHFQKEPMLQVCNWLSYERSCRLMHVQSHAFYLHCVSYAKFMQADGSFEFARSMTFLAEMLVVHTKTWLDRDCALGFEDNVKHDRKKDRDQKHKIKEEPKSYFRHSIGNHYIKLYVQNRLVVS